MAECRQTTIYVGLNDSVTHEQHFETEKYLSILKNMCKSYRVPFSVNRIDGGYFHDDGSYVEENTLVLTMVDVPQEIIKEIATDLCIFFRQESVMVTVSNVDTFYVRTNLES